MDSTTIIGLGFLSIFIMIVILIVDLWQVCQIKNKTNESIGIDKYYELKWRINLLLSGALIASLTLGSFGYYLKEDLSKEISILSGLTDQLQDSLKIYKKAVEGFEKEQNEREERVGGMDDKIVSLSRKSTAFQNDFKNNIGKFYKDLRHEDVKAIMAELETYPDKIDQRIGTLKTVSLPNKYYQQIKEGTKRYLYNSLDNERYLCLLFKNYPMNFVQDIGFMNNVTRNTRRSYQVAFKCLDDKELINFISVFIDYIHKNDGIQENESELLWLDGCLSSIRDEENKDFKKIAEELYKLMKTKDNKFFLYEMIRNRRIEFQENDKRDIKKDHKNWIYSKHQLPYFRLLHGQYEDKNNTEYQNELLQEIQEILNNNIG